MNERIKLLAKQAGLKFPSEEALSPVEKKFAELIVQECAEIADKGWAAPGIQIKQHFGVEE